MAKEASTVKCPNCGTEINVSEILFHQVQEQLSKDFEEKSAIKEKDYQQKLKDFEAEKDQLIKDKETVQQQIENAVKTKLTSEKVKIEATLRLQIDEEKSGQLKSLEEELKQKSEQVKELNKAKADIGRLEREKDELRGKIEAEEAEKFNKQLSLEK